MPHDITLHVNHRLLYKLAMPRPSTAPRLGVDKVHVVRLIIFFFNNFNTSSVFGIQDTLLSYNP